MNEAELEIWTQSQGVKENVEFSFPSQSLNVAQFL